MSVQTLPTIATFRGHLSHFTHPKVCTWNFMLLELPVSLQGPTEELKLSGIQKVKGSIPSFFQLKALTGMVM